MEKRINEITFASVVFALTSFCIIFFAVSLTSLVPPQPSGFVQRLILFSFFPLF